MATNYEDLARKLKALAERGEGGEAQNAQRMLDELMAKHGLTLEDLEREETRPCWYTIMPKHQNLFFDLVFHVVRDWDGRYKIKTNDKSKLCINLTVAQEIELTAKFDFYVKAYDKQFAEMKANFEHAFIVRNELWANKSEKIGDVIDLPTPEQLEKSARARQLARALDKTEFHQQLTTSALRLGTGD